jgi:glycosyltransferase involved in cell wall biosynthesis
MVSGPTVLQVVPSLHAGGAERTTIDIACALRAAGFVPLVVSEGGRLEAELKRSGGELIRLPIASKNPATMWRNAGRLADIIRKRNVSLIHARSRAPGWSALAAARRTGIPYVATYHGIYPGNGPFKRLYNSVMARGDAVIANSEWTAAHIRATYPHLVKRLAVIPRGLDLDTFNPDTVRGERIEQLRRSWGIEREHRVLLLPGRVTRNKGHGVFLAALSQLKRQGSLAPDIRAVVAGDPQGRDDYVREVEKLAATLDGAALLVPHVSDMAAAYLASDIVVSPSTAPESFGRVPPEAALMRRPVIATDHGGSRETVLAGRSGLLVPPRDSAALAAALADLLARSEDELARMGEAGRAHVVERYTVERMCADTLALYGELLNRPKP